MSSEITYTLSLAASKGGASIDSETISDTVDMSGANMATFTQAIGTSNEAVGFPADVSGVLHVVVTNLDATNYVELFYDNANTYLMSKLLAGESCAFRRVASTALFARANTASCQVQVWACQA